jgi:hypothetical protein
MKTENLINAHDLKCCHGDGVVFTNHQFKKCSCHIGEQLVYVMSRPKRRIDT